MAALLIAFRSLAEAGKGGCSARRGPWCPGRWLSGVRGEPTSHLVTPRRSVRAEGQRHSWCRDSEGWLEVADKVESFLAGISAGQTNIYQDLSVSKDAAVILSAERAW